GNDLPRAPACDRAELGNAGRGPRARRDGGWRALPGRRRRHASAVRALAALPGQGIDDLRQRTPAAGVERELLARVAAGLRPAKEAHQIDDRLQLAGLAGA